LNVWKQEIRHGVGRPRRLYFLTERGRERFPTHYLRFTLRLLEQLKETMPKAMVDKLFSQIAKDMAANYKAEMKGLSIEEKLKFVESLLENEGFYVEWEKQGSDYIIKELGCPYYYLGQNHPEICSLGQTLISTILSIPAEQVQCVLKGDNLCTFVVPTNKGKKETKNER
jgi:predicted ArsR family transcriptional regulator